MTRDHPGLAVVGAGNWGRNLMRTIEISLACRLVAVVSRNPQTAAMVGPDCSVVASYGQLFTQVSVDGILIATPTPTHVDLAKLSIERGIPVLVEKPLALTVASADALATAADAYGVFADVDYIHLFNDAYRMLKQRVAEGGPIEHIESIGGSMGPYRQDTSPLWDYGSHDIAMCCDIMSEDPKIVSGRFLRQKVNEDGISAVFELALTYPSGVTAIIECGNAMPDKIRQFNVTTRDVILRFDDLSFSTLTETNRKTGDSKVIMTKNEIGHPLGQRIQDFCVNLGRGTVNPSPLWFSVSVTSILAALEESILTETQVHLDGT